MKRLSRSESYRVSEESWLPIEISVDGSCDVLFKCLQFLALFADRMKRDEDAVRR